MNLPQHVSTLACVHVRTSLRRIDGSRIAWPTIAWHQMARRARALAPLLLVLIVGACHSAPKVVDPARKADLEAIDKAVAEHGKQLERRFLVVQDGELVAALTVADDAVRAAEAKNPHPAHRYVFRLSDREGGLHRMVFLPAGGIVAGRAFLSDLGVEVGEFVPGRPVRLIHRGTRHEVDLIEDAPLVVKLETLDGESRIELTATLDPDFDGGLLVPIAVARHLRAHLFEVPGAAEVQVALGRPFTARRALVRAELPLVRASGPARLMYEHVPGAEKP